MEEFDDFFFFISDYDVYVWLINFVINEVIFVRVFNLFKYVIYSL